jgi:hypothetical protein
MLCETFDVWCVYSTEQLTELSDGISTLEVYGETSREQSTGKLVF